MAPGWGVGGGGLTFKMVPRGARRHCLLWGQLFTWKWGLLLRGDPQVTFPMPQHFISASSDKLKVSYPKLNPAAT